MKQETKDAWDWEISSRTGWWDISIKEHWVYRHLLARLVRKEFLLNYAQTVLGPIWIFFQPILTLVIFVLVFGNIIGIPTGHTPQVLFFLSGIILWNFFNDTFSSTAFVFIQNAELFNKVYFPRLIIPLSSLASQLFRFLIQVVLLLLVMGYYALFRHSSMHINIYWLGLPFIVMMVGLLAFSIGILFSVLTAKYRDLTNIVQLMIRLFMFVTPVIYPYAVIAGKIRLLAMINPLSSLFEYFRFALLGEGIFTFYQIVYSAIVTILLFVMSLSVFARQSTKVMDVV